MIWKCRESVDLKFKILCLKMFVSCHTPGTSRASPEAGVVVVFSLNWTEEKIFNFYLEINLRSDDCWRLLRGVCCHSVEVRGKMCNM